MANNYFFLFKLSKIDNFTTFVQDLLKKLEEMKK